MDERDLGRALALQSQRLRALPERNGHWMAASKAVDALRWLVSFCLFSFFLCTDHEKDLPLMVLRPVLGQCSQKNNVREEAASPEGDIS